MEFSGTQVWKNKKGRFLFEGSHWRIDVRVLVMTVNSIMKLYLDKGRLLGMSSLQW